jgi:deazaflavin-dependent oxidoreductase (nitroreductase family)
MRTSPPVPPPGSFQLKIMNAFVNLNVAIYKASGGRLGGKVKGAPVLLLDHVGRKSGKARTTPVLYMADGDNLVVVGSRGGSDATPAWWLNVIAKGGATVQVGRDRRTVSARQASPQERAELWPRLTQMYSDYDVYQTRTSREIPVMILSPA